jgi:hypothetical protein
MKTLLLDATALGPAAAMNLSIRCIVPILPRRSSDQLTEGSQPLRTGMPMQYRGSADRTSVTKL